MNTTDDMPRRRLLQPLLDLFTRRRAAAPAVPTPPRPAEEDFGDDLLGIYTPEPAPAFHRPSAPDGDSGPGGWTEEAEQECVLDGAPYYGIGVLGRYCSWACANADWDPEPVSAESTPTTAEQQPPARPLPDGDDPWSSAPTFPDRPTP